MLKPKGVMPPQGRPGRILIVGMLGMTTMSGCSQSPRIVAGAAASASGVISWTTEHQLAADHPEVVTPATPTLGMLAAGTVVSFPKTSVGVIQSVSIDGKALPLTVRADTVTASVPTEVAAGLHEVLVPVIAVRDDVDFRIDVNFIARQGQQSISTVFGSQEVRWSSVVLEFNWY
jgi:hypothetical protein